MKLFGDRVCWVCQKKPAGSVWTGSRCQECVDKARQDRWGQEAVESQRRTEIWRDDLIKHWIKDMETELLDPNDVNVRKIAYPSDDNEREIQSLLLVRL